MIAIIPSKLVCFIPKSQNTYYLLKLLYALHVEAKKKKLKNLPLNVQP